MIHVGVVGAGYWGPNLIRNFYNLGYLKIVCDKDENRLEKIKENYPNINTTCNFEEVLTSVDAVIVATEDSSHYSLSKVALLHGKDVFVEKPLALSVKEAEELVRIARENSCILMVGHLLLYHPAIRKLKEYVKGDTLGEINYVYSQRVNLGQVRRDTNALWSLGPHDISSILYLLDKVPNRVVATGESYLQKDIYDVVFVTLHFPGKLLAHIHLSWLDPHKIRKLTVVGSKKMAVFDDMESNEKIRLYDKGVYKPSFESYASALTLRIGDILIPKIDAKEPLRIECEHFIDCVKSRNKPVSDGENGLQVVKILEAAQKSLDNGGIPIKIED